jgi:hypothetical protein
MGLVLIVAREDLTPRINDGGIGEIASLDGFDSSRLWDIAKVRVFALGECAHARTSASAMFKLCVSEKEGTAYFASRYRDRQI